MLGAQPRGLAGRVQRIGEQQQCLRHLRLLGGEHRRLPPAVGLAAEKHIAGYQVPHLGDGVAQPGAVGRGAAWRRWPGWSLLPERQVAAQHGDAGGAESLGCRDQHRHATIAAGPVREHEAMLGVGRGPVQEAPDPALLERCDCRERAQGDATSLR